MPRSTCIDGRATFTIATSKATMNWAVHAKARIRPFFMAREPMSAPCWGWSSPYLPFETPLAGGTERCETPNGRSAVGSSAASAVEAHEHGVVTRGGIEEARNGGTRYGRRTR